MVVWASRTKKALRFASQLPGHTLIDENGDLARRCEIRATPTIFIVSRSDFTLADYNPEGDVEWILNRLPARAPDLLLPQRG